jgi:hypothetical protein
MTYGEEGQREERRLAQAKDSGCTTGLTGVKRTASTASRQNTATLQ